MGVSLKKVFTYMRISLRLGPGQLSSASPNPPQLIKEGFLDVLLLVLLFFSIFLLHLLENFLPTSRNSQAPSPQRSRLLALFNGFIW